MPHHAATLEAGPDWINASIVVEKMSDMTWSSGEQTVHGNSSCQYVTGYSWAWQSNGWLNTKVKSEQNECAVPTPNGFIGYRKILPLTSSYWQKLDISIYYNPTTFANPATGGMALVTNSYRPYSNAPTELYYVRDVLGTFNTFSKDDAGNVVRSSGGNLPNRLTYLDGRTLNLSNARSVTYSANGQWLVMNATGVASMRVNTDDMSVVSFAPGYDPQYGEMMAVSNSGNTVVATKHDEGVFVYDLTKCEAEKSNYASRNCQARNIDKYIQVALKESVIDVTKLRFSGIAEIRFLNESQMKVLVTYLYDGMPKAAYVKVTINSGQKTTRYLALGDSFSSGEGAGDYYGATNFYADNTNYNECHQSKLAYSETLNVWLTPDWYDSVACSGARMKDIYYMDGSDRDYALSSIRGNKPQAMQPNEDDAFMAQVKNSVLPGYLPQLSILKVQKPSIATITISGNDIGFANVVATCVWQPQCYSNRDDREALATLIDSKISDMKRVFASLLQEMSGDAPKLYVVGYPKIVSEGESTVCASFMGRNEREFANNLVNYLNEAIRIAADEVGARYVDVSDAFIDYSGGHDYRICGDSKLAVNGLSINLTNISDRQKLMQYIVESYHPNAFGHLLLAKRIREKTNNFNVSMPVAALGDQKPSGGFYEALVGDVHRNLPVTVRLRDDLVESNVVAVGGIIGVSVQLNDERSTPIDLSSVTVELHSSPIRFEPVAVSKGGAVSGRFVIPTDVTPGIHTVHASYSDISGQKYDMIQHVLVIHSDSDLDGDGVPNSDEACVIGNVLSRDSDGDGVDDACDSADINNSQESTKALIGQATAMGVVTEEEGGMILAALVDASVSRLHEKPSEDGAAIRTGETIALSYNNDEQEAMEDTTATLPESSPSASNKMVIIIVLLIIAIGLAFFANKLYNNHKSIKKNHE